MFLSPSLGILEISLYLEISPKISKIANNMAMLLEHFRERKPNFFYYSKVVGDALRKTI